LERRNILTKEEEKIMTDPLKDHKIVSEEEWVEARKALLKKEKEFTVLRPKLLPHGLILTKRVAVF
jgi:predicted dithiol-disulfide oxidoreductase (DUF899 family)